MKMLSHLRSRCMIGGVLVWRKWRPLRICRHQLLRTLGFITLKRFRYLQEEYYSRMEKAYMEGDDSISQTQRWVEDKSACQGLSSPVTDLIKGLALNKVNMNPSWQPDCQTISSWTIWDLDHQIKQIQKWKSLVSGNFMLASGEAIQGKYNKDNSLYCEEQCVMHIKVRIF